MTTTFSCRWRFLQMTAEQYGSAVFRTESGLKTVALDLNGYQNLGYDSKPALYVLASSQQGRVEQESDEMIREFFRFDLIGYVQVPMGVRDGIAEGREEFLKHVVRFLYSATFIQAMLDDADDNDQNGATSAYHVGSPATDAGMFPPHGLFTLPCEAILHYHRSRF